MTTFTDYALLAGASYESTRGEINRFPLPLGWTASEHQTKTSGFEVTTFTNGAEIVISYAGTGTAIDFDADGALAAGFLHSQLIQAAEYYLQIKAANPGATITLPGHSLGGGLAALIGVFFGETAITFDQAPFARAALLAAPDLKAALLDLGFTPAQLAVLTGYIELRDSLGIFSSVIPNAHLVTNTRVNGEFLGATYLIYNPIGTTVLDIPNTSPGVSGIELHSQALLAAFLQSKDTASTGKALNEVTVKLTDLLKMIFDSKLFAFTTDASNDKDVNFLEHLVRHEAGVQGSTGQSAIAADAMVTRFTADLWKLAQDGGLTMTDGNPVSTQFKDVSKTLMAFAMQKYYEETSASAGYGSKLFSDVAGGVQFHILDVSTKFATAIINNQKLDLNDAKGYKEYFRNYLLQGGFTSTERSLIQSMLPYLRDWTVQAGTNALQSGDLQNRGAFMLGGAGSNLIDGQTLAGGTQYGDSVTMNSRDSHVFQMRRRCSRGSRNMHPSQSVKGLPIRRNKVDSKGTAA